MEGVQNNRDQISQCEEVVLEAYDNSDLQNVINEYEYTHGSRNMSKLIQKNASTGEHHIYDICRTSGHSQGEQNDQKNGQVPTNAYNDYGDEGEMDFEANQEQRPMQLNQKLSCSELIS